LVQKWSSHAQKIEIKYGCEVIDIGTFFPSWNFSGFKMEFELKFREPSRCFISSEFDFKNLGVSEFDEIWPVRFTLHIVAK
jgi:hypothetical protein